MAFVDNPEHHVKARQNELHDALAEAISRRTVGDEDCATPIPNLSFFSAGDDYSALCLPGRSKLAPRCPRIETDADWRRSLSV